jgi:hypothetical protein
MHGMKRTGRKIPPSLYGPLVLAMTLILIGTLYVLRYTYFVRHLTSYDVVDLPSYVEPEFPRLSAHQIANLGWAHTTAHHPKSSYLNIERKKTPGTQRIGVFGDSFVEGMETEYGFDFPSLLEKHFHDVAISRVQVINFGVRSYGVHQSYLLWEYLGHEYNLDYVVVLPSAFHERRDSSFLYHYNSVGPVHARYILDGEEPRLVSVTGETRREAERAYNRIIPPWRYIRYDDKAPMFLRVLVPMDRQIRMNPFYYRPFDRRREVLRTYELLMEKLATRAKNLLVLCDNDVICDLRNAIRRDNVHFFRSRVSSVLDGVPELYRAPRFHLSALGNQLRAHELYFALIGKNGAGCDVVELSSSREDAPLSRSSSFRPLYEYENISVNIAGQAVASLVVHGSDAATPRIFEKSLDLQRHRIAALLWTMTDGGLTFVPIKFLLGEGEQLFLSFRLDGESMMIPLGRIDASENVIGGLPKSGNDDLETRFVSTSGRELSWKGSYLNQITLRTTGQIEDMAIVVEDRSRTVLRGEAESVLKRMARRMLRGEQRITFRPVVSEYAHLRAEAGQFPDVDRISKSGTLDLVLTNKSGIESRATIVTYHKTTVECSSDDRAYPKALNFTPTG